MPNTAYVYVRAIGAFACIVTLNILVLMAFLTPEAEVPRWSIYMLVLLIGGLLGLDALLEISPVRIDKPGGKR